MINIDEGDIRQKVLSICEALRKIIKRAGRFEKAAIYTLSLAEKWVKGDVTFDEIDRATDSEGVAKVMFSGNDMEYEYLLAVFSVMVIIYAEYPESRQRRPGTMSRPYGPIGYINSILQKTERKMKT